MILLWCSRGMWTLGNPIQLLSPLAQRIACRLEELLGVAFDQLTVNEYEPGVGLSAHVDTHSAFTGKSVCAPFELSTPLQQRTACRQALSEGCHKVARTH